MDALGILRQTACPAYATDEQGEFVGMNSRAELLLGYTSEKRQGKKCYELLCGEDLFGNVFCQRNCNIRAMARRDELISRFEIRVRNASGESVHVSVSLITLPGPEPGKFVLVHIFQPLLGYRDDVAANPDSGFSANASGNAKATRTPLPSSADLFYLTRRETEILRLLAYGKKCSDIATALSISKATVRNHTQNIRDKLDVHSQTEMVSFALRNGLV